MGKVYIVGAGPGDPELLTIKAYKILKKVDYVLYDSLVNKEIIAKIPERVKKVKVGKKKNEDSNVQQEKINKLLIKLVKEGKNVARLKGGDPFLFGRGGEEVEVLKRERVEYEIVPGITAAIGVPTYVGLPLTHRDYSSSLLIVPGHLKEKNVIDWHNLAQFKGTIVVLMGVKNLELIVNNLLDEGMAEDTPVCMIRNGTTKKQKILKGVLSNIVGTARKNKVHAPAVIVIGKVVGLI